MLGPHDFIQIGVCVCAVFIFTFTTTRLPLPCSLLLGNPAGGDHSMIRKCTNIFRPFGGRPPLPSWGKSSSVFPFPEPEIPNVCVWGRVCVNLMAAPASIVNNAMKPVSACVRRVHKFVLIFSFSPRARTSGNWSRFPIIITFHASERLCLLCFCHCVPFLLFTLLSLPLPLLAQIYYRPFSLPVVNEERPREACVCVLARLEVYLWMYVLHACSPPPHSPSFRCRPVGRDWFRSQDCTKSDHKCAPTIQREERIVCVYVCLCVDGMIPSGHRNKRAIEKKQ